MSGCEIKLAKSILFNAIMAFPVTGLVKVSLRLERIRPTSSWQLSTVASIARQVNPLELRHPLPLTVTGPTRPFNKRSDELAVTSQETSV